jgi:hypothetical protein
MGLANLISDGYLLLFIGCEWSQSKFTYVQFHIHMLEIFIVLDLVKHREKLSC